MKALVVGSIDSLGRNYVLAIEALNAGTGDVIARQQMEVTSKEQVLTALGKATAKVREQLGESLISIRQFDVPLPQATTSSLEALQAYSRALDEGRVTPRFQAIPHLKRAIELDPDFAMALALLSGYYANLGQPTLAPALSQRAFDLRDRVSERERFFISWRYYRDARQAWDRGLEVARSWAATYPRDGNAFISVGVAATVQGQYEQAVDSLRAAARLDPHAVLPRLDLADALLFLNRFDEAKEVLQQAEAAHLDLVELRRLSYLLAFILRPGK
ncbi:MAG TPA: tetratricopeptide repeat protein [Vicinamibacterales bacterium]|nr:tetratricopeptide repeat protein [Vicinamibacterales bacterium]